MIPLSPAFRVILMLKIAALIGAQMIDGALATGMPPPALVAPRWSPWTATPPATTPKPPRISCYECYGSLESCATDRRNLIGGPKIKRCARNEDQCLFRKDPYSDFVALTCSADCVPTAITFCCTSDLCNCIGPSGCPAALPKIVSTTPTYDEASEDDIAPFRTPPTTSRLFPHIIEDHDSYDSRLAAFVESLPTTTHQPETTLMFRFPLPPVSSFVKIAAKSLSLENSPDLLPTTRRPQNRLISHLVMSAAVETNETEGYGLHCWHCKGTLEECRMTEGQTSAHIKACGSDERFCSIIEFGDEERTVEMECSAKCSPVLMKHLRITCCSTPLCNCLGDVEGGDDCRMSFLSDLFFEVVRIPPLGVTRSFREEQIRHYQIDPSDRNHSTTTPQPWWIPTTRTTPTPTTTTTLSTTTTTTETTTSTTTTTTSPTTTTATTPTTTTETTPQTTTSTEAVTTSSTTESTTPTSTEPIPPSPYDIINDTINSTEIEPDLVPITTTTDITTTTTIDDSDFRPSISPGIVMPQFDSVETTSEGFTSCYLCYNCPAVMLPTDPQTQATECPTEKRVACVKAEANFVTLTRIDRYCSDVCPSDTDMVKYHCCDSNLCNGSNRIARPNIRVLLLAFITIVLLPLFVDCSRFLNTEFLRH